MNRECIRYLAGVIEGEGYLKHYDYKRGKWKNRGIALAVSMSDKDVMEKVGGMLTDFLQQPVKLRGPLYNHGHKELYEVRLYSERAYAVMVAIYEFMGKRRKQAILDCVQLFGQMSNARKPKACF